MNLDRMNDSVAPKGLIFVTSSVIAKQWYILHLATSLVKLISPSPRTTVSQEVQTRFSVQLAYAKFLSKIKGNF